MKMRFNENQKIAKDEINKAAMKMSNNKAAGKERVANELIKYAQEELNREIATN